MDAGFGILADNGPEKLGVRFAGLTVSLSALGAMLLVEALPLFGAQGASAETYKEAVEGTTGISHFWPMGESSGSSFADVVGGANAECRVG